MPSLVVEDPVQILKDIYHYVPGEDLDGAPSSMDEMFISGKHPSTSQTARSSDLVLEFDLNYFKKWFKELKFGMTMGAVPSDSDLQLWHFSVLIILPPKKLPTEDDDALGNAS